MTLSRSGQQKWIRPMVVTHRQLFVCNCHQQHLKCDASWVMSAADNLWISLRTLGRLYQWVFPRAALALECVTNADTASRSWGACNSERFTELSIWLVNFYWMLTNFIAASATSVISALCQALSNCGTDVIIGQWWKDFNCRSVLLLSSSTDDTASTFKANTTN